MVNSLSLLCCTSDGPVRFVVQPDRRQLPDRRRTSRGGRRADDGDVRTQQSAADHVSHQRADGTFSEHERREIPH